MAKSEIFLTFNAWTDDISESYGTVISFTVNGVYVVKEAVYVRSYANQFTKDPVNSICANNFKNALLADHPGVFTANVVSNVVQIFAVADNVVFADYSCVPLEGGTTQRTTAAIVNRTVSPPFLLIGYGVGVAPSNPCTNVQVTIYQQDGVAPFMWEDPNYGTVGLVAILPRTGLEIEVSISDSTAAIDSIMVPTPAPFDNTHINEIQVLGDPSGLYGTVTVLMNTILPSALPLSFIYSLDNVTYQVSNTFESLLPGTYTMYIRDNFGCTISQSFEVDAAATRPPAYQAMPRSNSFGWFLRQAEVSDCANPYNGTNAKPNDWKPTRWLNPKYIQPWCSVDNVTTQFRSNYDTLEARVWDIIAEDYYTDIVLEISKMSNNIGQRQIMDAKIYDRGEGQTGVYWLSGNTYDNDGTTVNGTYDLGGQLPEWAKVGQKFSLTGSLANGIFEIQQIIFDPILLVNAAIINRIYTDLTEPVTVKVDATYNRLNYETYEFTTPMISLPQGCYRIELSMIDSQEEYPTVLYDTLPFKVVSPSRDMVYIESRDHVDDGILYSTGITHKQRFQGLFYEQDFPSTFENSRDSRKQLNKLDGRVENIMVLEATDVPYWVHEKLALFIAKRNIRVNNLQVQFDEPFERERAPTYSRVNLKAEATVSGYEQYVTNAYDIL